MSLLCSLVLAAVVATPSSPPTSPSPERHVDVDHSPRSGSLRGSRHRRGVGLTIGGLSTMGGSYLVSGLIGLELSSDPCVSCRTGSRLLVPIVGPWLFLPDAKGSGKAIVAGLGIAQGAGLVLSIIGLTLYAASSPQADPDLAVAQPSLTFGVGPTSDGAFGYASARF